MNSIINKLFFVLAIFSLTIENIFAGAVQNAFKELKPIFTDTVVLDGMAILFIYMGFYMLYFTLLQFFIKRMEANKRIRVSLAIILSFFSGSTLIYAFKDSNEILFLSIGSWLLLLILIPGLIAFAYQYITWIWKKETMNKQVKFFWIFLGLLSIDFLFTQMLYWLGENANVGGFTGVIISNLFKWNEAIYDWLAFFFIIAVISLFIFIFTKGFGGNSSYTQKEENTPGIGELKKLLRLIDSEVNKIDEYFKYIGDFLKNKRVR